MRRRVAIFVACAVFLFTGITHGGQIEVSGDFSVMTTAKYRYGVTNVSPGWNTPSCSCDIDQTVYDCDSPFYSDTDEGSSCWDNSRIGLTDVSRLYVRSDASPTLDVTKDNLIYINEASLYFKNSDDRIILKSPDGTCYYVFVENGGLLRTASSSCP